MCGLAAARAILINVAAHHDRLEYVCQGGMLTRDVVRLVDNGVCVCWVQAQWYDAVV